MKPKKHAGWCQEQSVDCAWTGESWSESGSTGRTEYRSCANCGKVQKKVPAHWVDVPAQ